MNLFYQPERRFQLLSPAVMMDLWELVWLCRWVWETPSQSVWIRGNGRITWKASVNYTCSDPAVDLQTQAVQREGDLAHLVEAFWVISVVSFWLRATPPVHSLYWTPPGVVVIWLGWDAMSSVTGTQAEWLRIQDCVEPPVVLTLACWPQTELY